MDVRFQGLSLVHRRRVVFSNLSLEVPSGQIACFYGPTGSGKTSALLIAGGLLKPTAGDVKLGDLSVTRAPMQARRLTGLSVIDGFNPLLDGLTVRENLWFQCRLYGVPNPQHRVDHLLDQFDLTAVADEPADDLRQPEIFRTGLAMAKS
jgi:ABC-type multidrug transport system ATPase subunit